MKLLFVVLFLLLTTDLYAATYYVRTNGGNSTECTGLANVDYDGAGSGEACAWKHLYYALGWNFGDAARITGGDTVIVQDGSYAHGYGGAITFSGCDVSYPYECYPRAIPSGPNQASKTKIYGENYASCTSNASKTELYGIGKVQKILNFDGSDNFEVKCFELTDHEECGIGHSNAPLACGGSQGAQFGIYLVNSENGLFQDLNIHGTGDRGVMAGAYQNLVVTRVDVDGNANAGWDEDLGDPDTWATAGTHAFTNFRVRWNGCIEQYPPVANTPVDDSCIEGNNGGYGDGFAISRGGGLDSLASVYNFIDAEFSNNSSDGYDGLYLADEDSSSFTRAKAYGNNGNPVKIASSATINDSLIAANCGFFTDTMVHTGFVRCRAGGNALSWTVRKAGETLYVYGTTIYGQGDVLVESASDGSTTVCNGTEILRVRNSILRGANQWYGGDQTDDYYASGATGAGDGTCGSLNWDVSGASAGNIVYNLKTDPCPATGVLCSDPLHNGTFPEYPTTGWYPDLSITSGSPARGIRNSALGNATDFNNFTRIDASGGLEYGSTGQCSNGIQDGDETGTDCGGSCSACQTCGDNTRTGVEVCDGTDLNSQTCTTQGFASGTLACNGACTAFDTTSCVTAGATPGGVNSKIFKSRIYGVID